MRNSIKKYCEDYAATEKVCHEFNKKHWKGNLVVIGIAYTLTFTWFIGIPYIVGKVKEKKEERVEGIKY